MLVPLLFACDHEGPPSPSGRRRVAPPSQDEDAPVRALYLCANRFVLVNAHPFPVRVTWRIQGTDEQGELALAAAPDGDPGLSEVEVSARHRGTLELYRGDRLLGVRANEELACEPTVGPRFATASTSAAGWWTAPVSWPIVAIHMHLLRTGKVLAWGRFGDPYVYDPANGSFKSVPRWIATSSVRGTPSSRTDASSSPVATSATITVFPTAISSTPAPGLVQDRQHARRPLVSHRDRAGQRSNARDRRQEPAGQTGDRPGGVEQQRLAGPDRRGTTLPVLPARVPGAERQDLLRRRAQDHRYLNTSGSGSWSNVGDRRYGVRDYGAAVMYLPGKILYAGGGRTTATAETIDLNKSSPSWQWTGSMAYPRRHLNATVLPTGEVLVTSGTRGTSFDDPASPFTWRRSGIPPPAPGARWRATAINRSYHSTSLLLPDGRVLHAGSGGATLPNGQPAPDQKNAEFYSPPYLFQGARPTIASASTSISYGSSFTVGTPDAAGIAKVSLIALGSVTHAFDMNQRFMWLTFTRSGSNLAVKAPSSPNIAPPGYYMLFILNAAEVPSKARIVQLH